MKLLKTFITIPFWHVLTPSNKYWQASIDTNWFFTHFEYNWQLLTPTDIRDSPSFRSVILELRLYPVVISYIRVMRGLFGTAIDFVVCGYNADSDVDEW